jgi:hypothetical protein
MRFNLFRFTIHISRYQTRRNARIIGIWDVLVLNDQLKMFVTVMYDYPRSTMKGCYAGAFSYTGTLDTFLLACLPQ